MPLALTKLDSTSLHLDHNLPYDVLISQRLKCLLRICPLKGLDQRVQVVLLYQLDRIFNHLPAKPNNPFH